MLYTEKQHGKNGLFRNKFTKIYPHDDEFIGNCATTMAKLSRYFPIKFSNGHEIQNIGFWCTQCGRIHPFNDVDGSVIRLVEHVADVDASFTCQRCGSRFQHKIRLRDDKTYSYRADNGGQATESSKLSIYTSLRLRIVGSFKVLKLRLFSRAIAKKLSRLTNYSVAERNKNGGIS